VSGVLVGKWLLHDFKFQYSGVLLLVLAGLLSSSFCCTFSKVAYVVKKFGILIVLGCFSPDFVRSL
jgi:hypothetical protein